MPFNDTMTPRTTTRSDLVRDGLRLFATYSAGLNRNRAPGVSDILYSMLDASQVKSPLLMSDSTPQAFRVAWVLYRLRLGLRMIRTLCHRLQGAVAWTSDR